MSRPSKTLKEINEEIEFHEKILLQLRTQKRNRKYFLKRMEVRREEIRARIKLNELNSKNTITNHK